MDEHALDSVAKAIWETTRESGLTSVLMAPAWENLTGPTKDAHRDMARAAIEAYRSAGGEEG